MSSSAPKLCVADVSMTFKTPTGAFHALAPVTLSIPQGRFVSLIGPSGCGKSTIFNVIAGLLEPTGGRVLIDGIDATGTIGRVGYMLQKDLLLPWRTVLDNVAFGLEIQRRPALERVARARELLAGLQLGEFAGHYPHQLSGGMRQRVALARTLAVEPSVLLLDEPFSAVDAQTRMVLQRDLARTVKQAGKTALLITHDLAEAVLMADRVLVMSPRPGRIIDEITIDMPHRDDPIARRADKRLGEYAATLMHRLNIGEAAAIEPAA